MSKWSNVKIPKKLAERARKKIDQEGLYPNLPQFISQKLREYIGDKKAEA